MSFAQPVKPNLITLRERNGAARHDNEQLERIVKSAVAGALEEQNAQIVPELRAMLRAQEQMVHRLNSGMERLIAVVEGFSNGERETAVAGLTDSAEDDLPQISRVKVAPSAIFTMTGGEIAAELGIRKQDVSYLTSQKGGLNFLVVHSELWDHETFRKTKRRIWHPRALTLLAEILDTPDHPERQRVSVGCQRVLNRCTVRSGIAKARK